MLPDRVVYRLERTGRTEHERREVLLTRVCPSCKADWTVPRSVTPRHSGGREYRCEACGVHHKATQVDADGRPVRVLGWGAARDLRTHESGPDHPR